MKTRLFLTPLILISVLGTSCGDDSVPEETNGSIHFVIEEDGTRTRIPGATIVLTSDEEKDVTYSRRTDEKGECTFQNLPFGSYKVSISAPKYKSREGIHIQLRSEENFEQTIVLERQSTIIKIDPEVLDFGDNEYAVQKNFSIINTDYEDLKWTIIDADVAWVFSVVDADGKKSGVISYDKRETPITVTIDRNQLPLGDHECKIGVLGENSRAELTIKASKRDKRPDTNILSVDVDRSHAVFYGEIVWAGEPLYDRRGFVYSKSPILDDATSGFILIPCTKDYNQPLFEAAISDLEENETYFVRAFGENSQGIKFSSNSIEFAAIKPTVVKTLPASILNGVSGGVQFNGEIEEEGNPPYTEKGFCYKSSGEPTIADTKRTVTEGRTGLFSYTCLDLASNSKYYIRAYAIQNGKPIYGSSEPISLEPTSVSTSGYTNLRASSVTLHGAINNVGNPPFTEKGFFYSTTGTPVMSDTKIIVAGAEKGNYSYNLTGLKDGQNYYYRAYAVQNGKYILADETVSFRPSSTEARITTYAASNITATSARLNASVVEAGDPPFSEKGFCLSSDYTVPTIENSRRVTVSGTNVGNYSADISDLESQTDYYYRAYVIQNGMAVYDDNDNTLKFTTSYTKPRIQTNIVTEIGYTSAVLNGSLIEAGDPRITEMGFCYGTSPYPTITDNRIRINNIRIGDFNTKISNLEEDTKYYVRTYYIQTDKIEYSNQQEFETYLTPIVKTYEADNVSIVESSALGYWTARFRGAFVDGNPSITEFGFVYSTTSNPTIGTGTVVKSMDSGYPNKKEESGFTIYYIAKTLSDLPGYKNYHVRTYVKTQLGVFYGEDMSFITY